MNLSARHTDKLHPLGDGKTYAIRPIHSDNCDRTIEIFNHLSLESRYLRFAHAISKLPDVFLDDILHLDYAKEVALVAVIPSQKGDEEIIGISRNVTPPNKNVFEFSLSVSDSYSAHGIGTHLMIDLITYAKENKLQKMLGYVLSKNLKMLHLVSELGFQTTNLDDDPDFKIVSLLL